MRDVPWIAITLIFSAFVALIIVYYFEGDYKQNAHIQAIQETAKTSLIANRDNSSRLKENEFYIDKKGFETDFKNRIEKNKNYKSKIKNIKFEYLESKTNSLKAVRVKIQADEEYQATYKVNISET